LLEEAERGFQKAVVGLILGIVQYFVLSAVLTTMMGESGKSLAILVNIFSILMGLTQLERAKYWGLFYALGYFAGLFLIEQYLMESWEQLIYLLVIGVYILQKIARRARNWHIL